MAEKTSRAKQFAPFAALNGFYSLVRERERIAQPRRERTEEENFILSEKIMQMKKGSLVKIKYYSGDAYEIIEGAVTDINTVYRTLTVVKSKILFDDIYEIDFI